jgi:hypothetical protein
LLQIFQYQKTGEISIDELPAPKLRPGGVLVRNVFSLISPGTERASVETAQASILQKARLRLRICSGQSEIAEKKSYDDNASAVFRYSTPHTVILQQRGPFILVIKREPQG